MKKLTFNNGIKNYALFGILGSVLNSSFCAHQNWNFKSLKNALTHKAAAHLHHVSDQTGISSPGLLRSYFFGQMFRLRPFCVHRSFTTKSFSLGQFIWGVEGVLKQHHWTGSLSFDPILHQSIFRLSFQANPLKKSFSKTLFLGTARMSDGYRERVSECGGKMIDLVSTAADLSEVPREEKIILATQKSKLVDERLRGAAKKLERLKEESAIANLEAPRSVEGGNRDNLDFKFRRERLAEGKNRDKETLRVEHEIYEDLLALAEEHRSRLHQSMEVLKGLVVALGPGQEVDIEQKIGAFLETLNQKIKADYYSPEAAFFELSIEVKYFSEEVVEPIYDIFHMARKRLEQREDEELANREKNFTRMFALAEKLEKADEAVEIFCENRKKKKEKKSGSIGLEALPPTFKNC